jgi:hypothetical protein
MSKLAKIQENIKLSEDSILLDDAKYLMVVIGIYQKLVMEINELSATLIKRNVKLYEDKNDINKILKLSDILINISTK